MARANPSVRPPRPGGRFNNGFVDRRESMTVAQYHAEIAKLAEDESKLN